METLKCLPPPSIIKAMLEEWLSFDTQIIVGKALHVNSSNTLRNWKDKPEKMQVEDVIRLTTKAKLSRFKSYSNWMDDIVSQDRPIITINKSGEPPFKEYACERTNNVPAGSKIFHGGGICTYLPGPSGEHHAVSNYGNPVVHTMSSAPDHIVRGTIEPLESEE